jgi:hypothetical protein
LTLIERRNAMEYSRAQPADHFANHTGSHWHPRTGSLISHRNMTAAVIDSRGFTAARWADHRKVTQIAFKPDWAKHGKSAPFKRNDAMLETVPTGVVVFPGSGIQENLADKARALGIPVWRKASAG